MSTLERHQDSQTEIIDSDWKGLCRLGGVAALILVLYSIGTMVILVLFGTAPASAAECFEMVQQGRFVGLLRLDVLTMFIYMPVCYLLYLGIYTALRKSSPAYSLLAVILIFVGITLFLATPSPASLAVLSDRFASATTDAERGQLLAAGEAILASDMWHGTGAILGGILLQSGALLISVVMFQGKVFSRAIAYTGILTHGLDLAHYFFIFLLPGVGSFLVAAAGTLYLVWFPMVGLSLIRLGRAEPA